MSNSNTSVSGRSRPHRNAFPSARVADSNNTEPPTAHQQRALDAVRFFTLIKKIETFAPLLPDSVKEASTDDNELHCTSGIDDSPWGTLNCQLDKLFGVDTREDGRLKHIRRGEHGMSFVASHLAGLDWKSGKYPLDLVGIKLQRVVDDMEYLCPTTPSIPLPPTAMLHLQVIGDENEEGLEPESDY
ncbi:hypothetical protein B0H14DRAFT_2635245 [Mycena olivaceomarginata]|nr:hypothetical protein B0H14DRAFT_2635245 [Mycena olivaceomarginata]